MTETLTNAVFDCNTGETNYVPLTEDELAQRELSIAAALAAKEEEEAEKAAKEAVLASAITKLTEQGLTADEINALRGI